MNRVDFVSSDARSGPEDSQREGEREEERGARAEETDDITGVSSRN